MTALPEATGVVIELILAWIGAITVVLLLAFGGFVGVSLFWTRLRDGQWWWDDEVRG